jgi:hypothetical protein
VQHEVSVDVGCAPETVWSVLIDVARWPEWTASMTSVEPLAPGPLVVGSRVRIKQPKLPAAVWEVTDLQAQRSFSWAVRRPGYTAVADHELAGADGRTTVTLRFRPRGLLAPILGTLAGGIIRRYVQMEADGLKRRCESQART